MTNDDLVKRYFNKHFKSQFFTKDDLEFKDLVKMLNKKDKQVKNNDVLPLVSGNKAVCENEKDCKKDKCIIAICDDFKRQISEVEVCERYGHNLIENTNDYMKQCTRCGKWFD